MKKALFFLTLAFIITQGTANSAFYPNLPSQTGQSGNFLSTNGTKPTWAPVSGGGLPTPIPSPGACILSVASPSPSGAWSSDCALLDSGPNGSQEFTGSNAFNLNVNFYNGIQIDPFNQGITYASGENIYPWHPSSDPSCSISPTGTTCTTSPTNLLADNMRCSATVMDADTLGGIGLFAPRIVYAPTTATGRFNLSGVATTGKNNLYTIGGFLTTAPQTTGNTGSQQATADAAAITADTLSNGVTAVGSGHFIIITANTTGSSGDSITYVASSTGGDTIQPATVANLSGGKTYGTFTLTALASAPVSAGGLVTFSTSCS